VLRNHHRIFYEQRPPTFAAQKIKRPRVLALSFIRRIQKHYIHRLRFAESLQQSPNPATLQRETLSNLQLCKVFPQRSQRRLRILREPHMRCTAAQRLNPNRPSARVQIHKAAALHTRSQNIKQRLSQPVARRTSLHSVRSSERTGAISSCNHAHLKYPKPLTSEPYTRSAYNRKMRGWSFPIGRILGVDVRIHTFFLLLLGLSISYATMTGASGTRGFALWLFLLLAVAVREIARALGAAWYGLELRSILLLPTGGLMSYATPEANELAATSEMQKRMGIIGPLANLVFGLTLGAIALSFAPDVSLYERPWLSPSHLLRAAIWVNLFLGALNLLPASPLDGGRVFRGEFAKAKGGIKGARAATGLGQAIAVGLMVTGFLIPNMWLIMLGAFVLIGAHMEDQGLLLQSDVDAVRMRDVMLTQFSMLSASDTLEEALQQSVHTLQDVFPVVRGANLVGAVSRQSIVEALHNEGNGYVQGVMTRSFQTAQPDDSLVKTLRRIMAGQGAQIVPVLEGDRIVGIITPQNLAHSMGLLNQRRKIRPQE
jgi:Zn-dependent protease/predicted transcriptional regulator